MTVETFDPSAGRQPIGADLLAEAIAVAPGPQSEALNLNAAQVLRLAPLSVRGDWVDNLGDTETEHVEGLIRLFTLGEMQYPSWLAGEKSPVIALVRTLKARDAYNPELTRWIKSKSTNRFLPHGNLMDRL